MFGLRVLVDGGGIAPLDFAGEFIMTIRGIQWKGKYLVQYGGREYGDDMKKIRMNDLGEPFQKAVGDAAGEPFVVEDDQGEARYSVHRIGRPTEQQKKEALEGLRKLQKRADASMKKHGKTEDDLVQEILKDD